MIDLICERLRRLNGSARDALPQQPVSGLVLGIDRDPFAKVTLLLFDEGGTVRAVAKVARDRRSEPALEAEFGALCRLSASPPPAVRDQLPRPVLLERVGDRLVLVTTAIAGSAMTVGYYTPGHASDPATVRHDFAAAGGWLATFQPETATTTVRLGEELFRCHVQPVISAYQRRVGWSDWEAEAFAELEADVRSLPRVAVPIGVVHGDYAIGNILVDRAGVQGVIDWELSRPAGLPMADVLKFAASYSSFLDRALPPRGGVMHGHPGWRAAAQRWPAPVGWSNLTGFMYGFHGEGWYPELVRGFVAEHARRLGLPAESVPVLLRLFVAEQATVLNNRTYARGYQQLLHVLRDRSASARCTAGRPR